MADRLTLKGYDDVTAQTGTDLTFIRPTSGRDFHLFPKWWDKKGSVQYVNCAIFTVTRPEGNVRCIVPTSLKSHIELLWDDSTDTFKFPVHRGIDRVVIANASDDTILQEYQFSKISGGATLKRTISNLPDNPITGTLTITSLGSVGNSVGFTNEDTNGVAIEILGDVSGASASADGVTGGDLFVNLEVINSSDATFQIGETVTITETGGTGVASATITSVA
tara:strand:- start:10453 stop:11118 length:666 start_codon:yes stop_codon:yes gene_type:complete